MHPNAQARALADAPNSRSEQQEPVDNRPISTPDPLLDVPAAPAINTPVPGPRSAELLGRGDRTLYPGLRHDLAPLVVARKQGWTVTDVDGNVFVDLASASASVPLGAARHDLADLAFEQVRAIGNEDSHALASEGMFELAERLLAVTPGELTRVDIALNGTEAVETAIKLMRRATGRPMILGFLGGYHGESTTTATLGAEEAYISGGERALVPGFFHAPYPDPDPHSSPLAPARPGGSGDPTVDFIREQLLFHLVEPERVAGVIIEPVLGSGGCIAPPDSFWPALVELCREYDWLLCADEVKSGFGRSGAMFALDRWGVEPDLLCLGKAMGGGVMPIGAVLGNERAMGGYDDVPTGSTWSWLPGSVAAALGTLDLYEELDVLGNVAALETVAREELDGIASRSGAVGATRAIGCFQAIEFTGGEDVGGRDFAAQGRVAAELLQRGVIADSSTRSLNIQPSLLMPPDKLRAAYGIIGEVIEDVA